MDIHYDELAEQAVVGSMLEDNRVIPLCIEKLGEIGEAFLFTPHRILYQTMIDLYNSGSPCDIVTVAHKIEADNLMNRIGGAETIRYILECLATSENAEYYAGIIQDLYTKRCIVASAHKIIELANTDLTIDEIKSQSQGLITRSGRDSVKRTTIAEQVKNVDAKLINLSAGRFIEISTGFENLDTLTSGLCRKRFTIMAGLPGVGKSALVHNILYHISVTDNMPAVLYCYESDHVAVILRMIASQTGVDFNTSRNEIRSNKVVEQLSKIKTSNLMIIDDCPRSIEYAVANVKRLKIENPELSVAVFDHLHLMTADVGKAGNREREVAKISGELKELAKSQNIAVVGIAQLSRASIRRQENRPMLDDLRASGELEADADTVIFVYREDYYETLTDSQVSQTELIVRKNKDGATGTLYYNYNRAISKFTEA